MIKIKHPKKEIFLKNISTYEDIKKQILSSIKENERKQNIYKIILKGYVAEYFIINDSILYEKLENEFGHVAIQTLWGKGYRLNKEFFDHFENDLGIKQEIMVIQ